MTVPLPNDLEQAWIECAQLRQLSVEDLVREALVSYLRADDDDELNAWQEIRDEALRLICRGCEDDRNASTKRR